MLGSGESAPRLPRREEAAVDRLRRNAESANGNGGGAERGGALEQVQARPVSTTETLTRAIRISEETSTVGHEALMTLGKQREQMESTARRVDETHVNLMESKRVLRDMKRAICQEKAIKGLVIAGLVGLICIIIYVKWGKRR